MNTEGLIDEYRNKCCRVCSTTQNWKSSKTMKSSNGTFDLDTTRDREGSFEPELVKKNQTHMSDELKSKMLSLFALSNNY